ncbi:MAG: hypothetical protein WAW88_07600, partial [Nocardioides sp.]
GSNGRGPKTRLVPGINAADELLTWWLTDVRHQYGDDWADPDAPLFPSERRDPDTGRCTQVGTEALRRGLNDAVVRWIPEISPVEIANAMRVLRSGRPGISDTELDAATLQTFGRKRKTKQFAAHLDGARAVA